MDWVTVASFTGFTLDAANVAKCLNLELGVAAQVLNELHCILQRADHIDCFTVDVIAAGVRHHNA